MEKINPYYKLIQKILNDFRITARGLQDMSGISGLSTIIIKLRANPWKKLHPETIGKIEKTLNIIIYDTEEEEIKYKRVEDDKNGYGETGISAPKIIGVDDIDKGLENMNVLHYIEITEKIDTNSRKKGDIIVFHPQEKINDDDEIIIKLINGETKIRKCTIEENSIFYIENGRIKKIIKQDIECMYKIVGSMQLQS